MLPHSLETLDWEGGGEQLLEGGCRVYWLESPYESTDSSGGLWIFWLSYREDTQQALEEAKFPFLPEGSQGAVKLLLKLFNLKTSDKEQVYCLAHCTLTLWKLPIHLISPHDIGEKLRVLPFYRQGALALFADE